MLINCNFEWFKLLFRGQCNTVGCKIFVNGLSGKMVRDVLLPPKSVKGMVDLNKSAFDKTIKVPSLDISGVHVSSIIPYIKKYLLKMDHLKPVQEGEQKFVLLNPNVLQQYQDLDVNELTKFGISEKNFSFRSWTLTYDNWKADEILRAVLPDDQESPTGFSRIGHIVHVNLRDHLLPYKSIIGQILLEKIVNCRTVVNKTQNIDNTYRNFQMETISGDDDYLVAVKENGFSYEFDFSLVYWNPRLSTEHERIVKMLKPGDVLYDACAGVGPFSIPAAKKKCKVLANDLNPHSYKWLKHNATKNKVELNVTCFNKDAREFIKTDLKDNLILCWKENVDRCYHITMNLPAMAVEFLDVFKGLFKNEAEGLKTLNIKLPMPGVHVYCFAKGLDRDLVEITKQLGEQHLGFKFGNNVEVSHVRNVAPNKEMMRLSFSLTEEILFCDDDENTLGKRRISPSLINEAKKKCNINIPLNVVHSHL